MAVPCLRNGVLKNESSNQVSKKMIFSNIYYKPGGYRYDLSKRRDIQTRFNKNHPFSKEDFNIDKKKMIQSLAPSKGCQINPKGWLIDTPKQTIWHPNWKVQADAILGHTSYPSDSDCRSWLRCLLEASRWQRQRGNGGGGVPGFSGWRLCWQMAFVWDKLGVDMEVQSELKNIWIYIYIIPCRIYIYIYIYIHVLIYSFFWSLDIANDMWKYLEILCVQHLE